MPRPRRPAYLYLDKTRGTWSIFDGPFRIRTGISAADTVGAEQILAEYTASKYMPVASASPPLADVFFDYIRQRPRERQQIKNLCNFWDGLLASEISSETCKAYAESKSPAAARRDLETLRAAVHHWHREKRQLDRLPFVTLPPKPQPRQEWLTRGEVAKLLWAARRTQHLRRFIVLAFYTGSRSGDLLQLHWDQINLPGRILYRRPAGSLQARNKKAPPCRIGSRLLAHLRRWRRQDGDLIPWVIHYEGGPVRKLRRSWGSAARRAGIKASPHTMRHTRATLLMKAGVGMREAADFLGMSTEVLERVYGKFRPEWQATAAEV